MNNFLSYLNPQQRSQLEEIVSKLISRYQPEKIYCFGSRIESTARFSCFAPEQNQTTSQYDLLLITPNPYKQEPQHYINSRHKKGRVLLLCHSAEVLNAALQLKHPFFTRVYEEGMLLYLSENNKEPTLPENQHIISFENQNPQSNLKQATEHLQTARQELKKENHRQTLNQLHQAVKQSSIALIKLCMGYYSENLTLSQLLRLCGNFSKEAAEHFPQNTPEEIHLFNLLLNSTPNNQIKINTNTEEVRQLFERVELFLELAENLYRERLNE